MYGALCARLHMAPRFVRRCTGLQDEKAEVRCCGVLCVHAGTKRLRWDAVACVVCMQASCHEAVSWTVY